MGQPRTGCLAFEWGMGGMAQSAEEMKLARGGESIRDCSPAGKPSRVLSLSLTEVIVESGCGIG